MEQRFDLILQKQLDAQMNCCHIDLTLVMFDEQLMKWVDRSGAISLTCGLSWRR
jgi:hypothetical protein